MDDERKANVPRTSYDAQPSTSSWTASSDGAGPADPVREARVLRALGHPVRLRLVDALLSGPLSATEAGEKIGESPTTCSFHLRQLAKYGLIEQHETGPGRRRTWKLIETKWKVPASAAQVEGPSSGTYEMILDLFLSRARAGVLSLAYTGAGWDQASTTSRSPFYLTKAELADFSNRLKRLVEGYRDLVGGRLQDPKLRPRGARRVEVILFAVPAAEDADGSNRGGDDA